jgi:large subunit ribosomal protein L18
MSSISKRKLRHTRLRKKVSGTTERPRLAVHFSGRNITAQVIDDTAGVTIASVNTTESELRADPKTSANVVTAQKVGKLIAERGAAKNVKQVVFDRGGFKYHGKVKALADAAREAGLEF